MYVYENGVATNLDSNPKVNILDTNEDLVPGYKTNLFDIIVSGAQGLNDVQREAIAAKIREYINGNIPINTIINEVNIRSNE